jgi:hypothetical protein
MYFWGLNKEGCLFGAWIKKDILLGLDERKGCSFCGLNEKDCVFLWLG